MTDNEKKDDNGKTENNNVIVVSKIKEYLNQKGMQGGEDFLAALNTKVYAAINAAARRAETNKRKRLKGIDL